jgi:hypothetical protein
VQYKNCLATRDYTNNNGREQYRESYAFPRKTSGSREKYSFDCWKYTARVVLLCRTPRIWKLY